jgi:hypothetical protein
LVDRGVGDIPRKINTVTKRLPAPLREAPQFAHSTGPKAHETSGGGSVYANVLAMVAIRKTFPAATQPPGVLPDWTRITFPIGSILVREKSPGRPGGEPDLLAVMIKRRPGFDPSGGDWEYLVANGRLTRIVSRKRSECVTCHSYQLQHDFVYPVNR